MSKKIAVIGAGIAGLAAGCYARMNGFDVEVFENHSGPGGLCTSWKRGDYVFDGCIHWLTGSAEDGSFYTFWNELGALKGKTIIDHDEFFWKEFHDGTVVRFFTDADKLEEHLLLISPADEKPVRGFCDAVRKLAGLRFPMDKPFGMMGFFDVLKMIISMMPYGKVMKFANDTTVAAFAEEFSSPYLRESFKEMLNDDTMSMAAILFTFAGLHNRSSGYPVGGSLEFAKGIERRLIELGGNVRYKTPVKEIKVDGGKAEGVVLENGEEVLADYVVSAMDLYTALEKLLGGRLQGSPYERYFKEEKPFPSCVQVSLGVDMDFSGEPDYLTLSIPLQDPVRVGGRDFHTLQFKHYAFDPTLAPEGKTVVEAIYMTDNFEYWENLYQDSVAYKQEKERILSDTLDALEERFPGIKGRVEQSDVATPMTYVRYTNNWKGSFMTWMSTPENQKILRQIPYQLPDIDNLYFSGMWIMAPGGLPTGVKTSRDILQMICKKEDREFTTSQTVL